MSEKKIRVDAELYEKVKRYAAIAGYATADEFINHVLEKEMAKISTDDTASKDEVEKRLRGLGYIS